MALLGLQDVTLAFGGPALLAGANLSIERGERVCVLGRNGAGKSTLLKLLDGTLKPDGGTLVRTGSVSVARLSQEVPEGLSGTVFDVVAGGVGPAGELLAQYHRASLAVALDATDKAMRDLQRLHHALDASDAWQVNTRVETVLQHLSLDAEMSFDTASGGRKRQALLARALVRQPDILVLDEPTNHLDIEAVEWMEDYLIDKGTTLVFVTHDRAFLRKVATRIVELDRGRLVDWGGDYDTYLVRKEAALEVEAREWAEFDRKLAIEETWIRTGIQARRTRNEGRVRNLEALRVQRTQRRDRVGTVRMQAQEAERSGRLVVEARDVSFHRGERAIVSELSTTIMRGDRVGLIGPNGSGKTTLLKLLLGQLTPDSGTIRLGTNIELAYFDQMREQLDEEASVFDTVGDGSEFVQVGGARKHVHGYLQEFLFAPDRARTPVKALSGGERNRLLLARLFTRPFNVLVLDEPTNDLDIETLDLLEALLLEFTGTLLVVSHDRAFLDNVVTSTLVFEGKGRVGEYAGGYTDWVRQRPVAPAPAAVTPRAPAAPPPATPRRRKLSYAETRELEGLPDRIDAVEAERAAVYAQLADPVVLRDGAATAAATARLATLDDELAQLAARWEALETLASGG